MVIMKVVLTGRWFICLDTLDSQPRWWANMAFCSQMAHNLPATTSRSRMSLTSTFDQNWRRRRSCTSCRCGRRRRRVSTWRHHLIVTSSLLNLPALCSDDRRRRLWNRLLDDALWWASWHPRLLDAALWWASWHPRLLDAALHTSNFAECISLISNWIMIGCSHGGLLHSARPSSLWLWPISRYSWDKMRSDEIRWYDMITVLTLL